MGACAYLGWLGYRHTKTTSDYLLAGREVHPFIMAMSYGATFISTSAIVGFGGVAAMFGMSLLWLTFLNIFVGVFIAFVFLGGRTRRMGHRLDAHTFPELLGRRFDSKFIQVFAGLVIFLFMPIYAAAVLIGGTEFLSTAFMPNNYALALMIFAVLTAIYVFYGGLKGVLYTDALQGTIMVVGMLVLLIWAYVSVGGIVQGHNSLSSMKDQVFAGHRAIGHQGWTAMPQFGWGKPEGLAAGAPSPYDLWWIVVSTIILGVGIGVLAQPQLVVRFLTVKSSKELNRALAVGGTFILTMVGVAYVVGALSNAYFYSYETVTGKLLSSTREEVITKDDPGRKPKTVLCQLLHIDTNEDGVADTHVVAKGLAAAPKMPVAVIRQLPDGRVQVKPHSTSFTRSVVYDRQLKAWIFNPDSIIPTFITSAMPRWFKVVFLLTLLSAAMSTMSSQYHTLGTAMGRDVCEQLFGAGRSGGHRTVHIVRMGILAGLVLAVTIAYYTRGGYFIARATAIFFGLCCSTFLPSFIGGLYFRWLTKPAAITSMIVGFAVTAFWIVFVKSAEAGSIGIVRWFTSPDANGVRANSILAGYPNWPVVDPVMIALPLSALAALVVSRFTQPPSGQHLERCFEMV
ncbi:MAG: sodium:solute symporter family protein [Planctomycetota bacterium]|nr:sodium:solute symporter family protein [Planctomycetota bacterium]